MSHQITASDVEKICHLYAVEHKAMWQIAKELGIASGTVHKYLHLQNIPLNPPKPYVCTEETKRKISAVHKGKFVSEDTKKKISDARKMHHQGHKKNRADGYVGLYYPDYPRASACGYVMEHIYIMEQHIGRPLKEDEVVHHKNHIRNDNRLENLQLLTFKEHAKLHMNERWEEKRRKNYE